MMRVCLCWETICIVHGALSNRITLFYCSFIPYYLMEIAIGLHQIFSDLYPLSSSLQSGIESAMTDSAACVDSKISVLDITLSDKELYWWLKSVLAP